MVNAKLVSDNPTQNLEVLDNQLLLRISNLFAQSTSQASIMISTKEMDSITKAFKKVIWHFDSG